MKLTHVRFAASEALPAPFRAALAASILLVLVVITSASAAKLNLRDPIRLPEGQTLKAVYYFPHWWDPWKSDDAAVTNDLKKMKEIGFNTVCLDHEVSQAVDRDFFWLDREYKLANQEKMFILPWLQLQSVDRNALMKFSHLTLKTAMNQDKQPVDDCINYRDPEFKNALAHYVSVYLDRYGNDPALLKIKEGDKVRPVVGIMLEAGWREPAGQPLSFDEDSNVYFRKWMKALYYNLNELNKKWGTSYKSFDEIDPCDKAIFNYGFTDRTNPPAAIKEHTLFRARVIKEAMVDVVKQVRKRHPNALFVVEVAYPFNSPEPNADAYRWNNANDPLAVDFADIVFVRMLNGPTYAQGGKAPEKLVADKRVVLAYRLASDAQTTDVVNLALDCAMHSDGFAYYNWNEAADSTSAIYDKPARQESVKIFASTYDVLNDHDKLREAALTATAPATPAVVQPAANTEPAPAPAPAVNTTEPAATTPVAPAAPTAEAPAPAPAEQPAPAQVAPAPVEVPAPAPAPAQ